MGLILRHKQQFLLIYNIYLHYCKAFTNRLPQIMSRTSLSLFTTLQCALCNCTANISSVTVLCVVREFPHLRSTAWFFCIHAFVSWAIEHGCLRVWETPQNFIRPAINHSCQMSMSAMRLPPFHTCRPTFTE